MLIPRRSLLLAMLTAPLAPGIANCSVPQRQKVIVIGAGIAGLGAATALQRAGMTVQVVEARGRIGGRIHTSRLWPDLPMDLGASWIHGIEGNPVAALARQAGAELITTSYDRTHLHIDPPLAAIGVSSRGTANAAATVERAMRWATRQPVDVSMQAALDAVTPPGSLDLARRAQLDFHVSATYEQEFAGSARQLSAWSLDEGAEFGGDDALFPGGYGQIIDNLAAGMTIHRNRRVTAIRRQATSVSVDFADGSSDTADQVLMTVPLGVLKAGGIAFDPPLPDTHQSAIDRLGIGLLNKHWLRFDRIFWPPEFDWHEFLSARKGEWSEWVSFAKVNETPVLMVFAAADFADRIERLDDRAIIADIMATLRTMFGSATPDPLDAQITRWRLDPYALGAYSYYATGSTPADRVSLATPIEGQLHFAGEAVHSRYPGTVHGALLSGREAAVRILDFANRRV